MGEQLLPRVRTRGRVIGVSVGMFVCFCVWKSSVTYSHQPQARASLIELRKWALTSFQTSATPSKYYAYYRSLAYRL